MAVITSECGQVVDLDADQISEWDGGPLTAGTLPIDGEGRAAGEGRRRAGRREGAATGEGQKEEQQ